MQGSCQRGQSSPAWIAECSRVSQIRLQNYEEICYLLVHKSRIHLPILQIFQVNTTSAHAPCSSHVFCIHVGLPNGYLYEDLIVYCSEIDDYDILIGMDLISQSDFFLTNIKGDNIFAFQYPATGKIE